MSAPTLSALMPNYNHSRYLGRAIEAVVSQSRPPDEFLILDDGSTDDSVDVIRRYAARVPYIRLICHEKNRGLFVSIKTLLDASSCDFVYSGAADDCALPGFFERAMGMADRFPLAGVICGKVVAMDPNGKKLAVFAPKRLHDPVFLPPERFVKDWLNAEAPMLSLTPATIWRRDAWNEVGGLRAELGAWSDTFAIIAIAIEHGMGYVPEPLAAWSVTPGGLSNTLAQNPREQLAILDKGIALMRSPEFAARFSLLDIDAWGKRFRKDFAQRERLRRLIGLPVVRLLHRLWHRLRVAYAADWSD